MSDFSQERNGCMRSTAANSAKIAGKRLIHLQCHFGLDTLILAREGAVVTGLDFSPAAIAEARRLAAEIGVAADCVCADVYDARQAVEGEFDIVFTTWGTICWLPDIVRWAETIASLLAPGGVFYFADAHPTILVLEEREGRLVAEWAADTPIDEPLVFDEAQTYTGGPTPLTADAHLPVDPFAAANSLRADGRRVRPRLCA